MSMMSTLFRPGKGKTVGRYVAAFVNGAAVYRGDLVCWDVTAPASQGASGVLENQTLGTSDFVFAILPPAAANAAQGLQAGCVRGKTINDPASNATAQADDSIIIIQTWGVCDLAWVSATTCDPGTFLTTGATTGEFTVAAIAADVATVINATNSTFGEARLAAIALTADSTDHVRGTATAEERATIFVRCDF